MFISWENYKPTNRGTFPSLDDGLFWHLNLLQEIFRENDNARKRYNGDRSPAPLCITAKILEKRERPPGRSTTPPPFPPGKESRNPTPAQGGDSPLAGIWSGAKTDPARTRRRYEIITRASEDLPIDLPIAESADV